MRTDRDIAVMTKVAVATRFAMAKTTTKKTP
jgi:hypothetical protein